MAVAGGVSLLATLWLVWSTGRHQHLSGDLDLTGPQKIHSKPVPRVGGLSIALGVATAALLWYFLEPSKGGEALILILCALPAFAAGLAEDLTKRVAATPRLLATMVAAGLAMWSLGAVIPRADLPGFDAVLAVYPLAVVVTLLAVAGMANAINIIDGLNGLASMAAMLMFGAIAAVAYQAGDMLVAGLALTCLSAILGFFIFNFPAGLIFLGDGGAYFIGFLLAETCVLLMVRNPQVSPMFALLVCGYPIFETLFSIYRRKIVRRLPSMAPDGIHLHSLVYRRLMRWASGDRTHDATTRRNSMASPFLWALTLLTVLPATLFWNDTPTLLVFIALFIVTYLAMYSSIARFKTPRWLRFWRH